MNGNHTRETTTDAIRPRKHRICSFRSGGKKVIPPDRCWNASLFGLWPKYSTTLAFGELSALIIEEFYGDLR